MTKLRTIPYILLFIFLLSSCSRGYDQAQDITRRVETVVSTIAPKPTTIQPSGLPDYHLIPAPFVPQAPEKDWSQPWQDACEEAAVLIAVYYKQNKKPSISDMKTDILSLVDHETSQGWGYSVNLEKLSQLITEKYNYRTQTISHPSLDDLKLLISRDTPVLVPANGKTLFKENKHFQNGGPWYHFVVVVGYNDQIKRFIVHDVGTQHGSYFQYSYDLFMSAIHDLPSSSKIEEIDQGTPKIMYLLK